MALRITKAELPAEVEQDMIKQFGAVPEPFEVTAHNPKVARDSSEMGGKVNEWDMADEGLKTFAHMAVAALVGCGWCLDINYFQALNKDLDLNKASQVPRWRESDVFTPLERDVLEYAEAMTNTPPTVTDEQYASLLGRLGEAAMVELTASVAFANLATRNNSAHGISSQGFSDACGIPLSARPGTRPEPRSEPRSETGPETRPEPRSEQSGVASTA
ncbi:carboxymuconolactone decarboxylase family protein [Streptomyces tauricus]|uniref:carboxymuconolactone decarboxylase family protein n=1 Tax=Streptomyces tauricus TaxID=68274 RepID=UPI00342FD8BD